MWQKKGLSAVISTILLVLLAIGAVTLIASFLVPFIRDQLEGGKACYDTFEKLDIIHEIGNIKTCHDGLEDETVVIVSRKSDDESRIKGFAISLLYNEDTSRFDIIDNTSKDDIKMYGKDYGEELEIPSPGTERTYVIKLMEEVEGVQIAPILENGKLCKESSIVNIPECEDEV